MATTYYKDPILDDILNEIPKGIQKEVDMFFAISNRISEILKRKGWSQVDLAKAMGKDLDIEIDGGINLETKAETGVF